MPRDAVAAKEGDSGPGWTVKSYKLQGGGKELYCEYDGLFRLRPQASDFKKCGATLKKSRFLTSDSLQCSDGDVQLQNYTSSRRQKWTIKPVRSSDENTPLYSIVEDKGKNCKKVYLSAPTNPSSLGGDADTAGPVPLRLSTKDTWTWRIRGQDTDDGIDCLKVDLISAVQGTFITVNEQCDAFYYDSDIGDWQLDPGNVKT